jgi:hypothetical protein
MGYVPVRKQKCTGREFKMTDELRSYEMDNVTLYLGVDVNIFLKYCNCKEYFVYY